ncbi:hypothetical protein B7494_g678 [Chlorociboria aeruginascens]|nr:hypothetical protein B7494_g678 [Chlorociboria aeruginascens]
MYRKDSSSDPGISWSETTSPGSDGVEEIVRQESPPPSGPAARRPARFALSRPRFHRGPKRRRLRPGEVVASDMGFSAFEFSQVNVRRSMDRSDASPTSSLTLLTSGSSCSDPWSGSAGFVEGAEVDVNWDRDEDLMVVPKLEPLEDDVDMADVKDAPPRETSRVAHAPPKRPRGRPRKNPLPNADPSAGRVAKGRSKTGCITCRKRKKKCDEAKPKCMNCEKNAVICEGYPNKTLWRSGKERAEEGNTPWTCRLRSNELIAMAVRNRKATLPTIQLQPVIHAVETPGDKLFFEHYIFRLSTIFTVEGEPNNAFKDMLLPLAVQHRGLMHSILALSSKHINYDSPYGINLLQRHPDMDAQMLKQRSQFHHEEAMKELQAEIQRESEGDSQADFKMEGYGQMLCLVLQTLADPEPCGEHRVHLEGYQKIIKERPPENGPFLEFIKEFFQYHIILDEIISLPEGRARLDTVYEDWNLPSSIIQTDAVRLLGVSDGLFMYMSRITNIRNKIRMNMENHKDPVVDYASLYSAAEIDAGIREWIPVWPEGDSRDLAGLLYKQMMWVYLWRTIYPPKTTTWKPDPRITQAVDNGLFMLSQVPPKDPTQTLVLAPAFVLGCAAFKKEQRQPIRKAIQIVKDYMEYKNSDTALKVLEEVWRLMDERDEKSWDWQSIAHGMGMDFLAT